MYEVNATIASSDADAQEPAGAALGDEALDRTPGKGAVCFMCDY